MSHRSLRIAVGGLFFILLIGGVCALVFMQGTMRSTLDTQKNSFSKLITSLQNTPSHAGTPEEEISIMKSFLAQYPQFQALLLYSYLSGVEYMTAKDAAYVLQDTSAEPQLRAGGLFTEKISKSYYKRDGSSFSLEAVVRTLSQKALFTILALLVVGIAAAIIIMLLILFCYDAVKMKKKHTFTQEAPKKESSLDAEEEPHAEPIEASIENVGDSIAPPEFLEAATISKREETDILGSKETLDHIDSRHPKAEHISQAAFPEATTISEREDPDISGSKETLAHIDSRESETEHISPPLSKDPPTNMTSKRDESTHQEIPSKSIDSLQSDSELLMQRISEEMERCYYFLQDLSLAIIEIPMHVPTDMLKPCWNLIKKLAIIKHTVFKLEARNIAMLYPHTDTDQALEIATSLYENCKNTMGLELFVGISSLRKRIITPEFFVSEAKAAVEKAASSQVSVVGFAPDTEKFQELADEKVLFSFKDLENLPIPPPDFDFEEREAFTLISTSPAKQRPSDMKKEDSSMPPTTKEAVDPPRTLSNTGASTSPIEEIQRENDDFWNSLMIQ